MGRRDDYKGFPEIYNSRHLERWDKEPKRQDTSKDYQLDLERAVQDHTLAQRHAGFDESAKDKHMKYERASFVIVTSSEAYRQGWERMFGKEKEDGLLYGPSTGSDRPSTEGEREV